MNKFEGTVIFGLLKILREYRIIVGELAQTLSQVAHHPRLEYAGGGVEEQLQSGEALLPVDNRPFTDVAERFLSILNDDCTEKVRESPVRAKGIFRNPADVVPKGLPLRFFRPHIGTLKQWHYQTLRQGEDLYWRAELRVHHHRVAIYQSWVDTQASIRERPSPMIKEKSFVESAFEPKRPEGGVWRREPSAGTLQA